MVSKESKTVMSYVTNWILKNVGWSKKNSIAQSKYLNILEKIYFLNKSVVKELSHKLKFTNPYIFATSYTFDISCKG